MNCPKCNGLMVRDDNDLGQYKCPNCNFQGVCQRCENVPVHPHRKWHLCLDCICNLLDEAGVIELKAKWKAKINDVRHKRVDNHG